MIDYTAKQVGLCTAGLYAGANLDAPLETLSFSHVPSRDFNGDGIVDFKDFALLAPHWDSPVNPDPKGSDTAFDLDSDGHIDGGDLALFSECWLERTDCRKPATDPQNSPPSL